MRTFIFSGLLLSMAYLNVFAVTTDGRPADSDQAQRQPYSDKNQPLVKSYNPNVYKELETTITNVNLEKNTIETSSNYTAKIGHDITIKNKNDNSLDRSALTNNTKIKLRVYEDGEVHNIQVKQEIPSELKH